MQYVSHKNGYYASSQKIKSKINDITKNQTVKTITINQIASNVDRKFVNIGSTN